LVRTETAYMLVYRQREPVVAAAAAAERAPDDADGATSHIDD
jgi:hypothetical protein